MASGSSTVAAAARPTALMPYDDVMVDMRELRSSDLILFGGGGVGVGCESGWERR
jgi:hypothetical protein